MSTARARTAMQRSEMSRPIRLAVEHGMIRKGRRVLDYGCGRGADVEALTDLGISATGWDPVHRPDGRRRRAPIVYLGYVVNVIEDPLERVDTLRSAWKYADEVLIVAARLDYERDAAHSQPYADGWITAHRTFQKFFNQSELAAWIEVALQERPVAAGPGVYYVFRHAYAREQFLASRFRYRMPAITARKSDRLYLEHRALLAPLMDFVANRGRLPKGEELESAEAIAEAFGSLRRAFRVVLNVTDADSWKHVRDRRAVELLVYLALSRFTGELRFSDLPVPIQNDVRAFEGSLKQAKVKADRLLFAAGNPDALLLAMRSSSVGKLTPSALYVHSDALGELPALLQVYEGCARVLVGTIDEANLLKLSRAGDQVSYLSYPDFDDDPHPALADAYTVDVRGLEVRHRRYSNHRNPPILHRKELFLALDDKRRGRFTQLTEAEEAAGLFENPELIGTRDGWLGVLRDNGVELQGHTIVQSTAT